MEWLDLHTCGGMLLHPPIATFVVAAKKLRYASQKQYLVHKIFGIYKVLVVVGWNI